MGTRVRKIPSLRADPSLQRPYTPNNSTPLRITFLQLPVQETDSFYTSANLPLAAGYLAAYVSKHGPGLAEVVFPPQALQDKGGDSAILDWISRGKFNLVGFTLYLWNRNRSEYLARRIRHQFPQIILVAGGPEVANPVGLSVFDALFEGEGEEPFLQFLRILQQKIIQGNLIDSADLTSRQISIPDESSGSGRVYPQKQSTTYISSSSLIPLDQVPNPYLEGILPLNNETPLYLETLRGCPRRCSYCYYGKRYPNLRFFPIDRIASLFSLAEQAQVPEIYLMDPFFNLGRESEILSRLNLLRQVNHSSIPLHTEIVLEKVSPESARLMKEAGFRSVEVGLQSTNPKALQAVRRPFNREKFCRGSKYLKEVGIEIRTGIILGLPQDTLEEFRHTLDFIEELHLEEHLEVYLLSILPGTELRAQAATLGLEFMNQPPYWVLNTPLFPAEDLYQAIEELEKRFGITYQRPALPHFSSEGAYLRYLDLRIPEGIEMLKQHPELFSWDLTLCLATWQLLHQHDREIVKKATRYFFQRNPYTLFKLVVLDEPPPSPLNFPGTSPGKKCSVPCVSDSYGWSSEKDLSEIFWNALEELAEGLFFPTHYVNLTRTYTRDTQGRFREGGT
ncbi:MAG: B12-binding domain-containing radical SAM protein, partial [Spirochaetales bacterium]